MDGSSSPGRRSTAHGFGQIEPRLAEEVRGAEGAPKQPETVTEIFAPELVPKGDFPFPEAVAPARARDHAPSPQGEICVARQRGAVPHIVVGAVPDTLDSPKLPRKRGVSLGVVAAAVADPLGSPIDFLLLPGHVGVIVPLVNGMDGPGAVDHRDVVAETKGDQSGVDCATANHHRLEAGPGPPSEQEVIGGTRPAQLEPALAGQTADFSVPIARAGVEPHALVQVDSLPDHKILRPIHDAHFLAEIRRQQNIPVNEQVPVITGVGVRVPGKGVKIRSPGRAAGDELDVLETVFRANLIGARAVSIKAYLDAGVDPFPTAYGVLLDLANVAVEILWTGQDA